MPLGRMLRRRIPARDAGGAEHRAPLSPVCLSGCHDEYPSCVCRASRVTELSALSSQHKRRVTPLPPVCSQGKSGSAFPSASE